MMSLKSGEIKRIGKQETQIEGAFGGCFHNEYMVCARPNSGVWLAEKGTGDIKFTLQFKSKKTSVEYVYHHNVQIWKNLPILKWGIINYKHWRTHYFEFDRQS